MAETSQLKSDKKGFFGIYFRKLSFFAILALIFVIAWAYISSNQFGADALSSSELIALGEQPKIEIEINERGDIFVGGEATSDKLTIVENSDELRMVIIDKPKISYELISIELTVPGNSARRVEHEILAIHGVGEANSHVRNSSVIAYEALGVSPQATITIVAKLPSGVITHPFYEKPLNDIASLKFSYWLALAIFLPVVTIVYMFVFLAFQRRLHKVDVPKKESSSPPMAIPPAIVGVLYRQKIGAREIAATLIDLARRKDIVILDRERGFAFGKGKFDKRLLGYEKTLLSKVFREKMTAERLEVEKRIANHLYSKKISVVSAGIHAIATRMGYFRVSPFKLHIRYRLIGSAAFIIGLLGFLASLMITSLPQVSALFWLGMMASALIIAFTAGNIPLRSEIGKEALSNWLAFRKYLSNPELIPYSNEIHKTFEEYLPYAIVLDCESAWVNRFKEHNFIVPDWYVTDKSGLGIDDFCLSLFPIISYVGRSFAALREPGFE